MTQLSSIPFGNKTITIYNEYNGTETTESGKEMQVEKWQRTVVPNCAIANKRTTTVSSGTLVATDETILQIPNYLEFQDSWDFAQLTDKSGFFTVTKGDLIVLREVDDEVTDGVVEYIEQKYASISFKASVIEINNASGTPLPHIAVRG